jgi:tetrahydromethanopterin S-methyltransferase subunit F
MRTDGIVTDIGIESMTRRREFWHGVQVAVSAGFLAGVVLAMVMP